MAFIDQINQNVGIFIYEQDFLFIRGIIGSLIANNTFEIILECGKVEKCKKLPLHSWSIVIFFWFKG